MPSLTGLEWKSMNQNRKTALLSAGSVFVILVICGLIGYINDPRRVSNAAPGSNAALAVKTESLIQLNYCYSDATVLCIVSLGQDSANNSLIVIRNDKSALRQFYLKIKETDEWQRYECQPVQFSSNIFYCSGTQLVDNSMATIELYSKNDNRLVASGLLLVSINATPLPEFTDTPIATTALASSPATATRPSPLASETETPSYPNPPSPYPNYPNP